MHTEYSSKIVEYGHNSFYIQVDVAIDGQFAYSLMSDLMDEHNARIHEPLFVRNVRERETENQARMEADAAERWAMWND